MTTAWAYYNESDPFAADWLRLLIAEGQIAQGDVDDRDIQDVHPSDLAAYTQCHFFAGIGGWSHALQLAGWEDHRPVWTGSCPCQPFSAAGKRHGTADARHLWPVWWDLIRQCRPPVLFGEQVASPAGLGWFDAVHADLEGAGYAVGAADLCAAGVGAPHLRQRLWFVGELGVSPFQRVNGRGSAGTNGRGEPPDAGGMGDGEGIGRQRGADNGNQRWRERPLGSTSPSFWSPADFLPCRDGKARPVEPGTCPLAHGVPARVGRLRGYGNAVVPQVAQTFIEAYVDTVLFSSGDR